MKIYLVRIQGFRSIIDCHIDLGPMTVLYGANGSGKNSIFDALDFFHVALTESPNAAINKYGFGIFSDELNDQRLVFEFHLRAPDNDMFGRNIVSYRVEFQLTPSKELIAEREHLSVCDKKDRLAEVEVNAGNIQTWTHRGEPVVTSHPKGDPGRMWLSRMDLPPGYADIASTLKRMAFFSFHSSTIKTAQRNQDPDQPSDLLKRDGSNLASILLDLKRFNLGRITSTTKSSTTLHAMPNSEPKCPAQAISNRHAEAFDRIMTAARKIVPGFIDIEEKQEAGFRLLRFRFRGRNGNILHSERYCSLSNTSGGLINALACLLSVYQASTPSFVGIKLPEAELHTQAVTVLTRELQQVTGRTQILLTSNSLDVLESVDPKSQRWVKMEEGRTVMEF